MMIVLVGAWRNQDVKNFFGLEEKFILTSVAGKEKEDAGRFILEY